MGYYCFALGDFSTALEMMVGVYLSQEILRGLNPLKDSNGWILAKGWYCFDLRDFTTALEMAVKAVDSGTIALG